MKSIAVLILAVIAAAGRAAVPEDPKEMTRYFCARLAEFDFTETAQYTHPDDLERFKQLQIQGAALAEEIGLQRYFQVIPWAKSSEHIASMDAADVYANHFRGMFGLIGEHAKEQIEDLKQQIKGTRFEIVGQTEEEDGTVYVVYRHVSLVNGVEKRELSTQGFRRFKNRWLCLIDEENFFKPAENIARMKEAKAAAKPVQETPVAAPSSSTEPEDRRP